MVIYSNVNDTWVSGTVIVLEPAWNIDKFSGSPDSRSEVKNRLLYRHTLPGYILVFGYSLQIAYLRTQSEEWKSSVVTFIAILRTSLKRHQKDCSLNLGLYTVLSSFSDVFFTLLTRPEEFKMPISGSLHICILYWSEFSSLVKWTQY